MMKSTLLGFLAGFGSFSRQSEVLCTQGLAYLLRVHEEAQSAVANEVEARTGVRIGGSLNWKAEVVQDDKGRVDLEACTAVGIPVVKIEAKLGAELTRNQLQSYAADLRHRNRSVAALLVLVPKLRADEATKVTAEAFALSGTGPWRVTDGHPTGIAVISWEDLFTKFLAGKNGRFLYELEQLQGMYRELSGHYIAPFASNENLRYWRDRETDLINLVDQVTRKLAKHHKVLPLKAEPLRLEPRDQREAGVPEPERRLYRLRYVAPLADNPASFYSIGVRDSFEHPVTPLWMRFHKETGDFRAIRQRIESSSLRLIPSDGHIWIPLKVPRELSGEPMVQALVEQVEKVVRVAYQIA